MGCIGAPRGDSITRTGYSGVVQTSRRSQGRTRRLCSEGVPRSASRYVGACVSECVRYRENRARGAQRRVLRVRGGCAGTGPWAPADSSKPRGAPSGAARRRVRGQTVPGGGSSRDRPRSAGRPMESGWRRDRTSSDLSLEVPRPGLGRLALGADGLVASDALRLGRCQAAYPAAAEKATPWRKLKAHPTPGPVRRPVPAGNSYGCPFRRPSFDAPHSLQWARWPAGCFPGDPERGPSASSPPSEPLCSAGSSPAPPASSCVAGAVTHRGAGRAPPAGQASLVGPPGSRTTTPAAHPPTPLRGLRWSTLPPSHWG